MHIEDLSTPCLLLDSARLQRNCERMRERTQRAGVALRPHLKTLKSVDAARLAVDASGAITVSTLMEAEHFAAHGFNDILCAVCLPPAKIARALQIHQRIRGPGFAVLIDSLDAARHSVAVLRELGGRLPMWLEIDCGEHRTGIDADGDVLLPLGRLLAQAPEIDFRGVLTHAGQSYRCTTVADIQAVAETERERVVHAATRLRGAGLPCPGVGAGSTPTAVHGKHWSGVTELRPGVYMAGDLFQAHLQAVSHDELALSVLASVISQRPGQFVIDAGGLALSKDRSLHGRPADPGYGEVLSAQGEALGWQVADVHQEHGEVMLQPGETPPAVGSRVRVLTNHACMTAAAYGHYHVIRGDEVVAVWPRVNGWG